MKLSTAAQKTGLWVIMVTVFLLPLFFLPITAEFYEFNKNYLLVASTLLLVVLWAVVSIAERQVKIIRSPLGLPMLSIVTAWLASAVLQSPNRVAAFLSPGQAGTWMALALFFASSLNFIRTKKEVDSVVYSLAASLATVGLISLLWSSNAAVKLLPFLPSYMLSELWNPVGSVLAAAVTLASALPLVGWLVVKTKTKQASMIVVSLAMFVMVLGLGSNVYRLINPLSDAGRPVFLPHITGWGIALESLKSSPLLGTGPATFLADFARFRPLAFNLTPNWSLRFITSSNYYLQLLTVVGLAGLGAYLFLVLRSYKLVLKTARLAQSTTAPHSQIIAFGAGLSVLATFVLQLFLPINFVLIFLTVVYLVILISSLKQLGTSVVSEASIDIVAAGASGNSPLLPWAMLALATLLLASVGYLGGRAYVADTHYYRALTAAAANDGRTTYNNLIAAMSANPFIDDYRITFSRTSLLLASSIAANPELSDTDRQLVTQLVQQAIQEAKNAVALDPTKVTNLENLAIVYRNLLNFAEGADAWTIASYQQAIILDPVNPNLRIALGGVFYGLQNWDEAIRLFQQAVDLKPNLANAYYNLSAAYREKGDLQLAAAAMQRVVQLVDPTTSDYDTASAELAQLQSQIGPAAPAEETETGEDQTSLSTPEPLPTPALEPPLELDESLSPEATTNPSEVPSTEPTP